MSKYEERTYRVGRKRPDIAEMKRQLLRLRHDLEQFTARKAGGAVVDALRTRIQALESEIAEAEADRKRTREAAADEATEPSGRAGPSSGARSTVGHFPPRGRRGH